MTTERLGTHGQALAATSIRSMLDHQVSSGAFVASKEFPPYRYSWLRDGSFVAFALDLAGEREAAERFHRWVAEAIARIAPTVREATERRLAGQDNVASKMPPARFALDGSVTSDDWPNFQIDGYGTWLWALSHHVGRWQAGPLVNELEASVELAVRYLEAVGQDPCFDCWEESGTDVHTSTLACVYGGLSAGSVLTGRTSASRKAEEVASTIASRVSDAGTFEKSSARSGVDASLLWLAVPFGAVEVDDPVMAATASAIEEGLIFDGGIRRYKQDTYYGSGAWPLLTAWLGWYRASQGDLDAARRWASEVERHFDSAGRLPEQAGGETRDPTNYLLWVGRWGEPAADLTWAHAMYFVLWDQLNKRAPDPPPGGDPLRRPTGAPHPPKQATKQATPQPPRGPTEKEGTA
ncbi:MAG: glycoside hydrolase family 15 protein [Acidimicrobiales bacterium]|jgi:GH15 family glucan-1,4-alpha-glucosidase